MTAVKMLPLIEAMRVVVRARYSARPALADEVQTADWFRPPFDGSVRPVEERQAVADAFDTLKDAIASQDVRLHGRLNGGTGADINPTEIDRRGISVLENELEVYQKRTSTSAFQHLRTYLNVHCYAADIDALIGMPLAESPADTPSGLALAESPPQVEKTSSDELAPPTSSIGRAQRAIAQIRNDPSLDVDKMSAKVLTRKVRELLNSQGVTAADLPSLSTVERAAGRRTK